MDNKQLIKNILEQNRFSEQEVEFFELALEYADMEELQALAVVLQKNPDFAKKLYQNYKQKVEALQDQDADKWDKIVKEEIDMLLEATI